MGCIDHLLCMDCGGRYEPGQAMTCTQCGPREGILDVQFDLDRAARTLTPDALSRRARYHWRYEELLPFAPGGPRVPREIGGTPLIHAPRLAHELDVTSLRLKDDGRSASGSSKDRASSVAVSLALAGRHRRIACASTGNAASSLAHCAAVAGLEAFIFVPKRVPEGKLVQLLAYGARVFRVDGTYEDAYELSRDCCRRFGWYERNCAVNPYLVEGKKTAGLEIAEQCSRKEVDWVVASVGDGCSIAGLAKGLLAMTTLGFLERPPRVLGVQAKGAAVVAHSFDTGMLPVEDWPGTYADSIDCRQPRNWRKAGHYVRQTQGAFVTVDDEAIRRAVRDTGRLAGIFAEPAGATPIAGIREARSRGIIDSQDSVVALISGNGLKDVAGALSAVGQPFDIAPRLTEVERVLSDLEGEK